MAWAPPFGRRHTTPPRSELGRSPVASMVWNRMAMHVQTDCGHCLIRFTCHPSCPGALDGAMSQINHQSSSPVKACGCHPVVTLGGTTLIHPGAVGFCQIGHQAASLAYSKARSPEKKPSARIRMPVLCWALHGSTGRGLACCHESGPSTIASSHSGESAWSWPDLVLIQTSLHDQLLQQGVGGVRRHQSSPAGL